jgi:hypothetical protein
MTTGTDAGAAGAGTGTGADTGTGTGAGTGTGTGTGTGAPAAPWHGYTAPEDVAYVANKGWQGAPDAVRSYRDAEKLIGRDPSTLLVMPRADDPAGFLGVMDKLGRPADATKYELDVPKGATADEGYQKWAKDAFHKLGLTAAQAKTLSAEHNAYAAARQAQADTDYKTAVAGEKQALLNEWKGGHERMMNAAQTAAKSLGFTGEMVDAMEAQIGYAATMKFFAGLGSRMGEDSLVLAGDKSTKFGDSLTPAEAKSEWEAKKLDEPFMKALMDKSHPGHAGAQKKQTDLFAIMFPNN